MTFGTELLRYKKHQKYFVFDFETEGLNLFYSRPYQCSFIAFTQSEIIEQQDHFIWFEDLQMSPEAARITRFNYADYKAKARPPEEVLAKLDRYIEDPEYIPVYHNGLRFDSMTYNILRRICGKSVEYDSWTRRSLDTSVLAKAYQKGIKLDTENLLAAQYRIADYVEKGLKSSIPYMAKEFDIPFEEGRLHEALYDCGINVEIFRKLIWKIEI